MTMDIVLIVILIVLLLSLITHENCSNSEDGFGQSNTLEFTPWESNIRIELEKNYRRVGFLNGKRVKRKDLAEAMKNSNFTWGWVRK